MTTSFFGAAAFGSVIFGSLESGPLVGVGLLAIAVPNAAVVCAVLAYAGALAMLYSLTFISYCQTTIPREFFARAFAVYKWITWGSLPVGSLLAGLTAELGGTVWVFEGVLSLAGDSPQFPQEPFEFLPDGVG